MNKQVIITNGSGGCGKDTFATILSKYCPTYKYSSIDLVKEILFPYIDVNNKTEEIRRILSDVKIALKDNVFEDLRQIAKDFYKNEIETEILILDIREPSEIDRAKKEFDAITVLIKNDNVEHITSNMADANVFNYNYDYVIDNSSTLDNLNEKVQSFYNLLNEAQDEK